MSNLYYDRTDVSYHIIVNTALMSRDEIAVPEENLDIPFFTKIYSRIRVYCNKDAPLYGSEKINIDSKIYLSGNNIVKIVPDYTLLIIDIALVILAAAYIFNLSEFFIILHDNRKNYGNNL